MLRRMPGGAFQHLVQGLRSVVGGHDGGEVAGLRTRPPRIEAIEHPGAVACDILPGRHFVCAFHDQVVTQFAGLFDRIQKRIGDPEHVMGQTARRSPTVPERSVQHLVGHLPHEAHGLGQDHIHARGQHLGRQARVLLLVDPEEPRDVGQGLGVNPSGAPRDHRDAACTQCGELVHGAGLRLHVDRFERHTAPGEELLGAKAAGAPGRPENANRGK
jgi:hypothetical protein